jgi:hypothetical protein
LNSCLFAVLLVVAVLSPTCDAQNINMFPFYVNVDNPVSVPYAKINSVGSVDPYVEIGVPFEIAFDGCVGVGFDHYGFYIGHTGGEVPWPPGLIPGDKSTILYGSACENDVEANYHGPRNGCQNFSAKVTVTLYEIGRVGLRLVAVHGTKDYYQGQPVPLKNSLTWRDFEVTVVKNLPDVKISDVQYVKPPDSIAEGETTPVVVKVKYDLPEDMTLQFDIKDLATGSTVGSWDSTQKLIEKGVFTSSPINITSFAPGPMDASRAGDWNLRIKVSADSRLGVVAKDTKDITIKVVAKSSAPPDVNITKVEHVEPPDTITLGEPTPVIVTAKYRNLQSSSKLLLRFKDRDTGQGITETVASETLKSSGTYVFRPVQLKASKIGDWHLQAVVDVNAVGESTATSSLTIKVVAPQASAQTQITSVQYVNPPDTILVGESTPVVVGVKYQNLVPGTKLSLYIIDQTTNQRVASTTSIVLSGSGTYTFPPTAVKPVNAANWRLKAEVRLGENTLASDEFTIKVVHQ